MDNLLTHSFLCNILYVYQTKGMNKMNKYILTDHAIERYVERTTVNTKEVKKSIMRDLKALKNKRIINVGDKQYVFYKHSKEYILQKKGDNYILLTVIKHKRGDKEKAIDKRLREKAEYEETMDAFKNYKK